MLARPAGAQKKLPGNRDRHAWLDRIPIAILIVVERIATNQRRPHLLKKVVIDIVNVGRLDFDQFVCKVRVVKFTEIVVTATPIITVSFPEWGFKSGAF